MSATQDILSMIDIDQIANLLGVPAEEALGAASQAVESLVGGIQSNTDLEGGATSLANALGRHVASPVIGSDGAINLDAVDVADGQKIVEHVIAPQRLALFGGSGSLVSKLLPLLAPIVMAYLAKRLTGGLAAGQASSGGLGDILGQVLGGGQGGQASSGGLGDILGQVLGGQQAAPADTTTYQQPPSGNGTLTMDDPGGSAAAPSAGSTPSVGGLLKSILFGN